jgi:prevent-host-death family protein
MATVGSFEAKTRLSELLERAEKGEQITITRRGVPVAVLGPVRRPRRKSRSVLEEVREFRKGNRLGGISIRQLIEEGRRYS